MKKRVKAFDKYKHYENSVQTPGEHVGIYDRIFTEVYDKKPLSLREDFCGTHLISCEWVKSDPKRVAYGVDLDPEPLIYGQEHGFKKLKPDQKRRVHILQKDVLTVRAPKVDVIGVGNFSFFIFKTRTEFLAYAKSAYNSLKENGAFILELAGGPGFIAKTREQKTYRAPGLGKFTYYWDQQVYDPIRCEGMYAIHFKDQYGQMHRDAFVYDWRVWSLAEINDVLIEAGFQKTRVYWEATDKDGEGTGEYLHHKRGDNAYSWIAFSVGLK